ncbi:MAG: GAF domain-containing protein [Gammaproteobacteria bacterium]
MKTFIKVSEIWVPDKTRSGLELMDGIYGLYDEFKALSERKSFAYGQGLPGRVWASGRPIVLTDLANSFFQRTEAAHAVGLTCAIGVPVFAGEFLTAVIVFLCGDGEDHAGAIEVWANDPDRGNELGVVDGYYGTLDYFEFVSRKTKIMKGFGLPGLVWQREKPVLMEDLGNSSAFIRGRDAKNAGITTGIGIPITVRQGRIYIMVFLSAKATPIARRLQLWQPDDTREKLACLASYGIELDDAAAKMEAQTFAKDSPLLGKVWRTGVPVIERYRADTQADGGGAGVMLAMPVTDRGLLQAVVTFLF